MAVKKTTTTKRSVARKPTAKSRASQGIKTSYGAKKESALGYAMSKLDKIDARAARKKSRVETRAVKSSLREMSRSQKRSRRDYTISPGEKTTVTYTGRYKEKAPGERGAGTTVKYTKELTPRLRKATKELRSDERFGRTEMGTSKRAQKDRKLYAKSEAARVLGQGRKSERLKKRLANRSNREAKAIERKKDTAYASSGVSSGVPGYGQKSGISTAAMQSSCPSSSSGNCASSSGSADAVGRGKTRIERRTKRQEERFSKKRGKKTTKSAAGVAIGRAATKISPRLGQAVSKAQSKKINKYKKKIQKKGLQNRPSKGSTAIIRNQ